MPHPPGAKIPTARAGGARPFRRPLRHFCLRDGIPRIQQSVDSGIP